MNRNVTKTVTHHILPCLGLLIVEAVSCVLAVYGIVTLLGYDVPSLYWILSGILKAVALVILLLISVGSWWVLWVWQCISFPQIAVARKKTVVKLTDNPPDKK